MSKLFKQVDFEEEQYYPKIVAGKRFAHKIVTVKILLFDFIPVWTMEKYSMIKVWMDMGFTATSQKMEGYYMGYWKWVKYEPTKRYL